MTESELRRRIAAYGVPFELLALRDAYRGSIHQPLKVNMGDHEEVLTVAAALRWAEHRARATL